ncbi:unnamed protein product [Prorocentrum cordatum]|uniref:Outer dense fiber protein 3 n=1 Tax=Prorocentrum cordatum TaxID=2364126 RepID=A0ABN9PXB9_9DINO|nr:unnamed protein product [Polarella glacialis]
MRAKLVDPSAKEARPEPGAYTIGGSTTHRGRMDAPSWTIGAGAGRQNGIPKPATQPGPGEYSLPSSLLPNPTMKRDGQVPFLTAKRRPLHEAGTSDVAPHDYQTAKGGQETGRPVVSQAPAYSMRAKLADPADRQKKPDCVTYTVKDGVTHKGPVKGPSWTVSPAGRASGMPKAKDPGPGPGEYSVPTTFEGKHPLFPSCASAARAETKRCDPDDTPVLYPDRHY